MRLLCIGDIHLRSKRLRDISSAWARTVEWAYKNKVDALCLAGDVFDHGNVWGREYSTGSIYDAFLSPIFKTNPIQTIVVVGNHDLASSPRDKDALSPIDKYPWITVVRRPGVIHINDELAICAVPWLNKTHVISKLIQDGTKLKDATKKVNEALSNLMLPLSKEVADAKDSGKFTLFMGHLEVTGAKREAGTVQTGGSFEFAPLELACVGADAYALAHIHVRQSIPGLPNQNDGYLGTICQLNFGEENQQVGCRLIEINNRKLISDKWMDNKASPKYYNASSLDGLQYRPGIDYVKLRGEIRPETLPQGIIFEKLPMNLESKRRTEEKLEATCPLNVLLEAWAFKESVPIPIALLTEQAEAIRSQHQVQSDAIGSLERIERIKIENITSHVDTEIPLNFSGICGICGPNGSGKSTAIETICLAPFGISPSRPILKNLLKKRDTVDAASEMEFVANGKRYVVRRELKRRKKTFTHNAYVFDPTETNPEKRALAGPSVEDVYKFCTSLIGDTKLVMSGIFSAQGDADNIANLDAAPRKDLFAKLLGTEQFLIYAEAAKDMVKADGAIIAAKLARLESIKIDLASEAQEKEKLKIAFESIQSNDKAKHDFEEKLIIARQKCDQIKESQREHIKVVNEKTGLEAALDKIVSEGRQLKAKLNETKALDSGILEASLAEARTRRDSIQQINEQLTALSEQRLKIVNEASQLSNKSNALIQDWEQKYSTYLLAKQKEINDAETQSTKEISEIRSKLESVASKKESLIFGQTEGHRRTALLKEPGFPNLTECAVCPLAKDIIAVRNGLPAIAEEIEKTDAMTERGKVKLKKTETEWRDKIGSVQATIIEKNEFEPIITADAKALSERAKTLLASINAPTELLEKKKALEGQGVDVQEVERRLAGVQQQRDDATKINARIDALKMSYKEMDQKIKNMLIPLAPLPEDIEDANTRLSDMQTTLRNVDSTLKDLNVEMGRRTAIVETFSKLHKEAEAIRIDTQDKAQRVDVLNALVKAFCRDGIPQLIVDSSIPHLNEILYNLLSECEGKWSMRVSSFREDAKGKIAEKIDILVDDGEDERDIGTFSGGERNLLEYVFRVAFSILQADRSGKGLKVLVLDEPMYFADDALADAFMRMIKKLTEHFNQIFIISHSDYILSSIENKIYFSRTSTGESVVQVDFIEHSDKDKK